MKKRNMKKFLVILFFSLTLQCGRRCPLEDWKKKKYDADNLRFLLQSSPKHIKENKLKACEKLVGEVEKLMCDIEQDQIMQPDQFMIEYLNKLLSNFTCYGDLLQCRVNMLQERALQRGIDELGEEEEALPSGRFINFDNE